MKERLGNYELIEKIDGGTGGLVYRAAEHMGHARAFAIGVFPL